MCNQRTIERIELSICETNKDLLYACVGLAPAAVLCVGRSDTGHSSRRAKTQALTQATRVPLSVLLVLLVTPFLQPLSLCSTR